MPAHAAPVSRRWHPLPALRRGSLAVLLAAGSCQAGLPVQIDPHLHFVQHTVGEEGALSFGAYRAQIQAQPVEGVDKDLSGLAYDEARDHLWAVVNNPPTLLALDRDGRLLARYPLEGFADVEAVVHLGGDVLAVVEERRATLVRVTVPSQPGAIVREGLPALDLSFAQDGNAGLEGAGYDRLGDRLFLVKEHSPRRLYELHGLSASFADGAPPEVIDRSDWIGEGIFASDLSSVEYDPRSGHLLLLSDESRMIVELDANGRTVGFRLLQGGVGGLERGVPQGEGLALGEDGALYLVSEPNLFYRFGPAEQGAGLLEPE